MLAALMLSGCGGDSLPEASAEAFTVRDSAGVTIVESRTPLWPEDGGWRVAAMPEVTLGDGVDDPDPELYRVNHGDWLPDGRFVISNLGSEVRLYAADGALVRRWGHEGEGPGEFMRIEMVRALWGRVFVADARLRRVSVFDTTGTLIRTATGDRQIPDEALLDDTTVIGRRNIRLDVMWDEGIERKMDSIQVLDLSSGVVADLAGTPGQPAAWVSSSSLRLPMRLRYGAVPRIDARNGRAVYGSPDVYEIREIDTERDLARIVRRIVEPDPIAPEEKERTRSEYEATGTDIGFPGFAAHLPFFRDLVLDHTGHLWARRERGEGPDLDWDVFDPEGRWLGEVVLPEGFRVLSIADTRILGVTTDAFDVETVEVREIEKLEM